MAEPTPSTTNRREENTKVFWEASLACRGFMPYVENQTFKSMIEKLEPLRIQGEFHKLRMYAIELVDMLVADRQERPTSYNAQVYTLVRADTNPCSEILFTPQSHAN